MVFSVCFPASAQVQMAPGVTRQIASLKPYDQIQTLGLDKASKQFTRIKSSTFFTYIHFDKDVTTEFLVLKCENGTELVISEAHILFKKDSQGSVAKPIMAKYVEIGNYLLQVSANQEIESIKVVGTERKTCQGVFAPLTNSGTLVVDGFLVSCYAHVDSHVKAHASMAPLRLWYKLNSKIGKPVNKSTNQTGIHTYAKTLSAVYGLS